MAQSNNKPRKEGKRRWAEDKTKSEKREVTNMGNLYQAGGLRTLCQT